MNDLLSVIIINTLIVLLSSIFASIAQDKKGYFFRTFLYYFITLFISIIPSTFLYEIICHNKSPLHLEISLLFSIMLVILFCLLRKRKLIMDFPIEFPPAAKIKYLLLYSVFLVF